MVTILQTKAQQVTALANKIMERTQDLQIIRNYLTNRVEDISLTPAQERKLQRFQFIYDQTTSGKYTDPEIVNLLKKQFGITASQAYDDMAQTRELFTTTLNINKRYELMIQLQINRKLLRKAEEMGDLKAYAALEKNRTLLIKLIPEVEEVPSEYFEGHTYELTFDPSLLGAPPVDMHKILTAINAKRKKKIKLDMFEEIEEVKDDTEEDTLQQAPAPEPGD